MFKSAFALDKLDLDSGACFRFGRHARNDLERATQSVPETRRFPEGIARSIYQGYPSSFPQPHLRWKTDVYSIPCHPFALKKLERSSSARRAVAGRASSMSEATPRTRPSESAPVRIDDLALSWDVVLAREDQFQHTPWFRLNLSPLPRCSTSGHPPSAKFATDPIRSHESVWC